MSTVTHPKISTLVFCLRAGKVLLQKRNKPPLQGYWVAPGGKVEPGESPRAGALRELYEETGLRGPHAELRAVVSETSPRPDWQWLMFVYRVQDPLGEVVSDLREGALRWFDRTTLDRVALPEADRLFLPRVLSDQPGVWEYSFRYDDTLSISERCEYGPQIA